MTSVQKINAVQTTNTYNKILNPRNTGYAALGGMCLTTVSAMIKSKSIRKSHKPLAFITFALTLLHLGTAIKHRQEKKKQFSIQQ